MRKKVRTVPVAGTVPHTASVTGLQRRQPLAVWRALGRFQGQTTLGLDLCRVETGARWKTGNEGLPCSRSMWQSHQGHWEWLRARGHCILLRQLLILQCTSLCTKHLPFTITPTRSQKKLLLATLKSISILL